jgi:tetrahydromethanopterin S-methyltransferase subunit D
MKPAAFALSLCLLAGLSACTSFSNYETVTVQTTANAAPVPGAQCALSNRKGTWIVTTPGSVSVHLGSEQLAVKCAKDGYVLATAMENSSPNFAAIMLDGAIPSTVSGSAWTYPQMITVPMQAVDP